MPQIDSFGNRVEKGAIVTDERTVSADSITLQNLDADGQVDIDVPGLVSVDEVIDISITVDSTSEGPQEVLEGQAAADVATGESVSIDGNTIRVQFYTGDLSIAGNDDLTNLGLAAADSVTVTAEGY